jgi:hypothetical protein
MAVARMRAPLRLILRLVVGSESAEARAALLVARFREKARQRQRDRDGQGG